MRRRAGLAGLVALCLILVGRAGAGSEDARDAPGRAPEGVAAAAPADLPELPPGLRGQLDAMEDIRDIRPPVAYGADPRWWIVGAALALVAAAVPLVAWLRRRRSRPVPAESEPPPIPPEEAARAALASLREAPELSDKAFYFRLCELTRAYLDGRFGTDTLEKTTEELGRVLEGLPLEAHRRAELVALFRRADPVRYADAGASPEERRRDLEQVEALLGAPGREGADGVPVR
ncbi:MAG: hypothetical protein Kow0092_02220 [Deferrisomatales bacterium]